MKQSKEDKSRNKVWFLFEKELNWRAKMQKCTVGDTHACIFKRGGILQLELKERALNKKTERQCQHMHVDDAKNSTRTRGERLIFGVLWARLETAGARQQRFQKSANVAGR